MPTYITLISYTQKGVENMKESPARLDAAKELYKSMVAELKSFYLTMGRYDAVVVSEAPDDETVAKLALTIGSMGAIRTETMRAHTEDEYRWLWRSIGNVLTTSSRTSINVEIIFLRKQKIR